MSKNIQLPKDQFEISSGAEKDFNRGNIISRKTDNVKDFTVTIRDIDFAIKYYFQNVIKPQVIEGGKSVDVPIIYGNPERWKSIQMDGYFKDEKDKIILPIIVFKRNTISKDNDYAIDKLDANSPIHFYPFRKKWSSSNKYDNFLLNQNEIPIYEYYNVVVPDYVVMSYDFIIMTETIDQMNRIVESVIYSEGSYWGEKDRFKFRTKIDSYNTTVETGANTQRTVKTTFSLSLNGYLVPDTINKQLQMTSGNVSKAFSVKKVLFGFDADTSFTENTPNNEMTPSVTSIKGGVVGTGLSSDVYSYIVLNITRVATVVDENTISFDGVNIYPAPSTTDLITTKDNFYFFINGQHISNSNVVSVLDDNNTVVVVFTGLAYSLDVSDTLVGVGKFKVL